MKKVIPNIITCIRLFLIPFIVYYFFNNINVSIVLFIIGSLSDALDGYLSRKWNAVSNIGKTLDTIADKLFALTLLFLLTSKNKLLIVTIILELTIAFINIYKKYHNLKPKTLNVGKVKTFMLCVMIISFLLTYLSNVFNYFFVFFFILTTIFQIAAITQYKSFQ